MLVYFPSARRTIWPNTDNIQGASRFAQDQVPVSVDKCRIDTEKIS